MFGRRTRLLGRVVLMVSLAAWSATTGARAVDHDAQSITIALLQDPPNLNSSLTTDLVSFFVLGHVQEGLVRYDRRGGVAPGVAASWSLSAKQMVFELNPSARWSDGKPVTARDFVYAWRVVNDPATAAPYASIMYPIRNAEEVQRGALPPTALGVSADGDHRLIVDLATPCGFCLKLMIHAAFLPIREDFHASRGDRYGAEPAALLYNGPFALTEWTHGRDLMLTRNRTYWNDAATRLSQLRVGYITEDNRTRLNLYKDGQIALVRLGTETVQEAMAAGLRVRTFLSGGLAFMRFNLREGRATADPALRRAIAMTHDGEAFVNRVIAVPGYKPAAGLFPTWLPDIEDARLPEADLAGARAMLGESASALPPLTLLTTTSPTGLRIAEFFQGRWKRTLGIDIKVDQQTFKQYLDRSRRGDFDIVVSSWYPDFDDVMTFADLLASWNANNRGGYVNDEYDAAVRTLQTSVEPSERAAAIDTMTRIIAQEVPVLPLAETGSAYIAHPQLRGVVRRVVGADPDYSQAWVAPDSGQKRAQNSAK
ncbi:MAG: hypothetical protein CMQ24_11470 [Gammaproteobacteria bacterium]|nr:hypothetical protein [Gammaproteobacteria bacterium]